MNAYRTDDRQHHIEPPCQWDGIDGCFQKTFSTLRPHTIYPHGGNEYQNAGNKRIKNLTTSVKFQMLLVACTDACNANDEHRGQFAVHKITIVVDHPRLHTAVDIAENTIPCINHLRLDGEHKELHHQ